MSTQVWCTGLEQTLVPGRLRGYRMWMFPDVAMPPTLSATNTRFGPWPSKHMTAACHAAVLHEDCPLCFEDHQHAAPNGGCGCGLWGWYRPDETRINPGVVFGVIAVSGRVLLGDYGFRAEHAEILAVCYTGRRQDVRDGLAERYELPVFDNRFELIEAFPPEDVRSLVPTAFTSETLVSRAGRQVWSVLAAVDPYETLDVTVNGVPLTEFEVAEIRAQLYGGSEVFLRRRGTDLVVRSQDPQVIQALLLGRTPTWSPPRLSAMIPALPPATVVPDEPADTPAYPEEEETPRIRLLKNRRNRNTGPKIDWRSRLERIRK